MIRVFVLITLCLTGACCFAQSQGEMNEDAVKNYQKSDKELNKIYQNILKEYAEDSAFIKNLKNVQRIWVQFRDAEMKAMYPDQEPGYYGNVQPVCW